MLTCILLPWHPWETCPKPEGSPSSHHLGKGRETKKLDSGCCLSCLCGTGTHRLWVPRGRYWSLWARSTTIVILSTLKFKFISYDHWFPTSSWPLHYTVFASHPQHCLTSYKWRVLHCSFECQANTQNLNIFSCACDQLLFIWPPNSYHVSTLSRLCKAVYLIFPHVHLVFHRTGRMSYLLK